jgi:hypothetical protein
MRAFTFTFPDSVWYQPVHTIHRPIPDITRFQLANVPYVPCCAAMSKDLQS